MLQITENNHFGEDGIKNLTVTRIGAERTGYKRIMKVIFSTNTERDEFLKNAEKLKSAPDPWNKVFIRKDQHKVYVDENNRLRSKARELRKNTQKEVKIFKGKLLVDNIVVDQNLFFH